MPGSKKNQAFLKTIFDIAVERCGKEFADEITHLRRERERLLKTSWREIPREEFSPSEKEVVFREIDFDTIVLHTARYLKQKEFLAFLYDIGEIAVRLGEFEKAQRLFSLIARRYYRSAGRPLLARTHQRLGDVAFYQNDLQTANRKYLKSLDLYNHLGDNEGIASVKNSMASLAVEGGKPSEAELLFKEAKELASQANLAPLLVKINCNLGNLYIMHGSWGEATSCYTQALANKPDTRTEARIHHDIAIMNKWQHDYTKAMDHLGKAIRFSTEANDLYMKGLSYLEQGEISCRQGDLSSATALATTAFQIFSELGDRLRIAEVYKIFGVINRESKRYDVALSFFENGLRINEDYNNPLNLGETLRELGQLYAEKGEPEKARENFQAASRYFEQIQAKAKIEDVKQALTSMTF